MELKGLNCPPQKNEKGKAHQPQQRRWSCCRLLAGGSLKRQNVIFVFLELNAPLRRDEGSLSQTNTSRRGRGGKKPQQPAAWSRRGGNQRVPLMKGSQRGKVLISPAITHWQSHSDEEPPEIYIKTSLLKLWAQPFSPAF